MRDRVLFSAALLASSASLSAQAQTTPHASAVVATHPIARPTPTVRPPSVTPTSTSAATAATGPIAADSGGFGQSLLVSSDGQHWAQNVTIDYPDPCGRATPSSCGVSPHVNVMLRWNPNGLLMQQLTPAWVVNGKTAYYSIDPPLPRGNCWPAGAAYGAFGPRNLAQWESEAITPDVAGGTAFSCQYKVETHWATTATLLYPSTCGQRAPTACASVPPQKIYLRWGRSLAAQHMLSVDSNAQGSSRTSRSSRALAARFRVTIAARAFRRRQRRVAMKRGGLRRPPNGQAPRSRRLPRRARRSHATIG